MVPSVRMRLELNATYHEGVAEYHEKMIEQLKKQMAEKAQQDDGGFQSPSDADKQQEKQSQDDYWLKQWQSIIELHSEAAKQLRDVLATDPPQPYIKLVQDQQRPARERGPVARTLMN